MTKCIAPAQVLLRIQNNARFFTTISTNWITNMMSQLHLPLSALVCPGKHSPLPWKMKLRTYKLLLLSDSLDRNSSLVCSPSHLMCCTSSKYLDVLIPKSQHDLEQKSQTSIKFQILTRNISEIALGIFLLGLIFTWGVKFRYNSYSSDSSRFNDFGDIMLCVYVLWWICSFCAFDKIKKGMKIITSSLSLTLFDLRNM